MYNSAGLVWEKRKEVLNSVANRTTRDWIRFIGTPGLRKMLQYLV